VLYIIYDQNSIFQNKILKKLNIAFNMKYDIYLIFTSGDETKVHSSNILYNLWENTRSK
jgi:hypothetical protein